MAGKGPRVLLTGASGFVGSAILEAIRQDYEVWALYARNLPAHLSRERCIQVDLTQDGAPV